MAQNGSTGDASDKDEIMLPYMQKMSTLYTFRRGIPEHLRRMIGKREFKIPVGADHKEICRLV